MKNVIYVILGLIALWGLQTWYIQFFKDNSWSSSNIFYTVLVGAAPLWMGLIIYGIVKWVKKTDFKNLVFLMLLLPLLQSCRPHAKSNQIVVTSEDCGSNWKRVPDGEQIPNGLVIIVS